MSSCSSSFFVSHIRSVKIITSLECAFFSRSTFTECTQLLSFFFLCSSTVFNICVWSVNLLVWALRISIVFHSLCVYDFIGTWDCCCKWISMTLIVVVVVITDDVLFGWAFFYCVLLLLLLLVKAIIIIHAFNPHKEVLGFQAPRHTTHPPL